MSMALMAAAMSAKVGNPLRKLVLIKLADNANDKGECWPSYSHIADQCEISRRSVIEHIKALEEMGFVEINRRKNGDINSSNVFIVRIPKQAIGSAGAALPSAGDSPGVVQEIHQGSAGAALGGSAGAAPRTSHSFEPVNEPRKTDLPDDENPNDYESANSGNRGSCPYDAIVDLYHETLPDLPRVKIITKQRKAALRARWNTSNRTKSLDWWLEYFVVVKSTPFLMGANDRNWRADFDFLITESKFAKIVEGGYQRGAQ